MAVQRSVAMESYARRPSRRDCSLHLRLPTVPGRWESIRGPALRSLLPVTLQTGLKRFSIPGIAGRIRELEAVMSREEACPPDWR